MGDFDRYDKLLQTHQHPRGAEYYSPRAGEWFLWHCGKWIRATPPREVMAALELLPVITQNLDRKEEVKLVEETAPVDKGDKYRKSIRVGVDNKSDIYDVLRAFGVTDPAHTHGIKKVLYPGQRGNKDQIKDLQEGINSLQMYVEYLQKS